VACIAGLQQAETWTIAGTSSSTIFPKNGYHHLSVSGFVGSGFVGASLLGGLIVFGADQRGRKQEHSRQQSGENTGNAIHSGSPGQVNCSIGSI